MTSLVLSMRDSPEAGDPLPNPIVGLSRLRAFHRRGQVSIVAAASGGGKSTYANHLTLHGRYPTGGKIPTLYFSADCDSVILGTRVMASALNRTVTECEELLRHDDKESWAAIAAATEHIWWNWKSSLDPKFIYDECTAYAYANGDYPHLVVVDNLINLLGDGDGDSKEYDWLLAQMQQMASEMNAHFLLLHHVLKGSENGDETISKKDLLDSVAKRPKLVLTIHTPQENLKRISVVKNSIGRDDPKGIRITTDVAYMGELSWMSG